MKKYKSTGCARFIVFILIFTPIAFFGSAYINGENGVEIIKKWIGLNKDKIEQQDPVHDN